MKTELLNESGFTHQSYCNREGTVPGDHFRPHLCSKTPKYFLGACRLHRTAHRWLQKKQIVINARVGHERLPSQCGHIISDSLTFYITRY